MYYFFCPTLGAFALLLITRLNGANTLMIAALFPAENFIFDIIIMHLLHSCTHSDLDHFCFIFHKSCDTVT